MITKKKLMLKACEITLLYKTLYKRIKLNVYYTHCVASCLIKKKLIIWSSKNCLIEHERPTDIPFCAIIIYAEIEIEKGIIT